MNSSCNPQLLLILKLCQLTNYKQCHSPEEIIWLHALKKLKHSLPCSCNMALNPFFSISTSSQGLAMYVLILKQSTLPVLPPFARFSQVMLAAASVLHCCCGMHCTCPSSHNISQFSVLFSLADIVVKFFHFWHVQILHPSA